MSFKKCINDGVAEGLIPADRADEINSLFDELEESYNAQMGPGPAATKASADASIAARAMAVQRKRRTLLQAQAQRQAKIDINGYRDGADPGLGALALFEQDTVSRFPSVMQLQRAVEQRATSMMDQYLATFRRDLIGRTRNKATMKDLIRELFNENTGSPAARELADAWRNASEYLRKRYNSAGGAIPKRADWGLPQFHSPEKVRAVGYTEWRDFISARLDMKRMVDEQTGLPFTPERLEVAMRDVYETIRTDGMSKIKPSGLPRGRSVATRRQDHRFLVFKNGDGWLEYQQRFGNPDPFDTMMAHISNMSRDIALMERLGPNPSATVNWLKQTIQKNAAGEAGAENLARRRSKQIDDIYGAILGNNNAPVDGKFAATFAGLRQVLQAAQLGSASIAALTDLNFQRIARGFNGLPQVGTIQQTLRQIAPLGLEEKGKLAIRLGLTAEGWSTLAAAQMRYVGDLSGPEITRRVADFVMRASLLSPWTQAGRWAFGMEFLGTLADNAGKAFKDLDPNLRGALERYGIGEDRWDLMRSTPLYEHQGAEFLRAEDIAARTDLDPRMAEDLATKLQIMIDTETNFAVPSASMRGRLALTGDVQPGTIPGEVLRSFAMYKNFSITVLNTHIMRGLNLPTAGAKGRYMIGFIVSTTLMGALAMQLKEMAKGRDPMPMDDEAFWAAAMLQGGGLGIFGDFLFSNVNRYDRGLAETIAGPVVGFGNDLKNLTIGNLAEVAAGEDTNAAAELVGFASRYTPGASLWYLRLGLERGITDQLRLMVDPDTPQRFRRLESRYRNDRGQDYWWRPGETTPRRAPDLSNILESRR